MRFMLPTFTPSYDSTFSDSIPAFNAARSLKPIRRQRSIRYVDKRVAPKDKVKSEITFRILPEYLMSRFLAYPWVGDKNVTQDHYRAPVIP